VVFGSVLGQIAAADFDSPAHHPPAPEREFRGVWVATVGNIDWPSRRGLDTAAQQAELRTLLDRAVALKLNAIIFQVRPACDALYASKLEPWSEFLTGTMGQPPEPFYDPLAFVVGEAHRRGLELHAWFNPFRARVKSHRSPVAPNHVSRTRPQLVRDYGRYLWLDPGEKETQDYSLSVVLDVLRRYDVDGIHFDDYFYPYRERGPDGKEMDFPDEPSWRRYGVHSGLGRAAWRRQNVDTFIQRVYRAVHAAKPSVKFGLSPFGIWRPGYPPQIRGFDAYAVLHADSRKWLQRAWLDYLAPQLYWAVAQKEQSFAALLDWWNQQNPQRRHIWPGLNTTRVGKAWSADEIVTQIRLAARQPVSAGHVHWNMTTLMRSEDLAAALARGPYAQPALVPACAWLDATPPAKPRLSFGPDGSAGWRASWSAGPGDAPRFWLLQVKRAGRWSSRLTADAELRLAEGEPEAVAVRGLDRAGNLGPAAVLAGMGRR